MTQSIPTSCRIEGCTDPARGKKHQLCNKHRLRLQRHGRLNERTLQRDLPCTITDCGQPRHALGLCSMHYQRQAANGSPHIVKFTRESHGLTGHELHRTWKDMKSRCYSASSPTYPYYGGRGIKMCDRWRTSFLAFLADVGERPEGHSLDRIDNNGNYEPGNVRWADRSTQSKNTRLRCDNKSGHKGVLWDRTQKRWRSYVGGGRSRVELGYYGTLEEAVAARHMATFTDPHIRCCEVLEAMRKRLQ